MTPNAEGPDRHYLATGAFDLSVLVRTSCGGAIIDLSHTRFLFSARIPIDRRSA